MLDADNPDPIEIPTGERRAAIISGIKAEAQRRRTRRRRGAALVGGAVFATLLVIASVAAPSTGERVTTAAEPNGTSSSPPSTTIDTTATTATTTTTTTTTGTPPSTAPTLTTARDTDTPPGPTPTTTPRAVTSTTSTPTALACFNSTDPACGPLVWQPDAGPNAPLGVTVSYAPEHPVAGEEIRFTITAHDPDAHVFCVSVTYDGWQCSPRPTCEWKARYGPWQTPPKLPTEPTVTTRQRTFAVAGTYQLEVQALSGVGDGCLNNTPWESEASTTVSVLVS